MTGNLWRKMYPEEEENRIKSLEEQNKKYELLFNRERKKWQDTLEPIFETIYGGNFNMNNSNKIVDAQAKVLSLRQKCNEQVSKYSQKLSKIKSENAELSQKKFLFYSTGFGLKTNLGEKKMLIDGHLRENNRTSNLIETHINFLRETLSTLESWGYSIKNVIQLIEYLGK
jgi:chromosome segregation ATPase